MKTKYMVITECGEILGVFDTRKRAEFYSRGLSDAKVVPTGTGDENGRRKS